MEIGAISGFRIILLLLTPSLQSSSDTYNDTCVIPPLRYNTTILKPTTNSISVECIPGYFLNSGEVNLTCNSTTGEWNDTFPECQLKICQNISLGPNMISDTSTAYYGESVNVSCTAGHRILHFGKYKKWRMVRCKDDRSSMFYGLWESFYECEALDCGEMEPGEHITVIYTGNTTYGESLNFTCDSGYTNGLIRCGVGQCSDSGKWEINGHVIGSSCTLDPKYIGCHKSNTVNASQEPVTSQYKCIQKCQLNKRRYAAVSPDGCFCADERVGVETNISNQFCNFTCPEQEVTSNRFCGGFMGEQAVYLTMDETACYENVQDEPVKSFNITGGDMALTCAQLCFGADTNFAVFEKKIKLCTCSNQTFIESVQVDVNLCINRSVNNHYSLVMNLVNTKAIATSCKTLFSDTEILTHGRYYVTLQEEPIQCHFLDGTECDTGWIGYEGSCYYFEEKKISTFEDNQLSCKKKNATIATILSHSEQNFISSTLSVCREYRRSEPQWYIGLYDPQTEGGAAFSWIDGNILQFSYFDDESPASDNNKCVAIDTNASGQWKDVSCDRNLPYICKKNNEQFSCLTMEIPAVSESQKRSVRSFADCVQFCIGRQSIYAVVKGAECTCIDSLPRIRTYERLDVCDRKCTGNMFQYCEGAMDNSYTVMTVASYSKAVSCEELQFSAITDIDAILQDSVALRHCNASVCPDHWIQGNSSCYLFSRGSKTAEESMKYCSKYDAYLAVPSDIKEEEFLKETLKSVPYFTNVEKWRLGIKSTGSFSGVYRTASGERLSDHIDVDINMTFVYITSDVSSGSRNNQTDMMSFVCERNQVYRGCYILDNATQAPAVASYREMSVMLCVEICRAYDQPYAMLQPNDCYCGTTIPLQKDPDCISYCVSGLLQPCGTVNTTIVSVYSVDMYEMYEDCMDLYYAGVRLHGVYKTKTGVTPCNFFDNSTVCDDGWVSYRNNCYIIINKNEYPSRGETCNYFGGRPGTILDRDMHTFVIGLIKGSESTALESVRIGLFDWGETVTPTWASGIFTHYNLDDYSEYKYPYDARVLTSISNYELFETGIFSKTDCVFCERKDDYIGCFQYTPNITTLSMGSGEIELTLCKQSCLSLGYSYAVTQRYSCSCANDCDITALQRETYTGDCAVSCSGGRHQHCGDKSVVNVYKIDVTRHPQSCQELYNYRILQRGFYLIKSDGQLNHTLCGFSDATACKAGWIGLDGYCFDIKVMVRRKWAPSTCIRQSGYPFTPYLPKYTLFLSNILNVFKAYNFLDFVWTGAHNRFNNGNFLSGDGRIAQLKHWNRSQTGYSYYIIKSSLRNLLSLDAEKSKMKRLPILCEKSPGYLGCFSSPLTGDILWSLTASNPMSVTTCQQLCIGRNGSYAAVSLTTCSCYRNISISVQVLTCVPCDGYYSQPCGSDESKSLSVFQLGFYEDELYESCDHLYGYGVTEASIYRIKPNNFSDYIYVWCFSDVESLRILNYSEFDVNATSYLNNYLPSQSRLTVFPGEDYNAWIPASMSGEYIKFTTEKDYIITGISVQGLQGGGDKWTTSFSLEYVDNGGVWTEFLLRNQSEIVGNTDKYAIKTHYFPDPLLTTGVRIYPLSCNNEPALRLGIHGQPFINFDHSTFYIGCYVNMQNYLKTTMTAISHEDCRLQCVKQEEPFFSFYERPEIFCSCGSILSEYGKYPDFYCFPDVNNDEFAFPVYRTYEKNCKQLQVNNTKSESDFKHAVGVYTMGSSVTFTCETGHRFPDSSLEKTAYCNQNNTWSLYPQHCQALNCTNMSAPAHTRLDGDDITFGSRIAITCDDKYIHQDGNGIKILECIEPGEWNDTISDCVVAECDVPPEIPRTTRHGNKIGYNSTVTYVCDAHTKMKTNLTEFSLRCSGNGTWEPEPQDCILYECEDPPIPKCGEVERINGTHARYRCNYWHRLSSGLSEHFLECTSNLTWNNLNVSCEIDEDLAVSKRQAKFSLIGYYRRLDTADELDHNNVCISFQDCAVACMKVLRCVAYSFNKDYSVCRLYSAKAHTNDLITEERTKYFELFDMSSEQFKC